MKYNHLNVTASRAPKRVGRGIAAGQGKTAGRGTKGQMARTGARRKPGFEGGQNPLMQRLPKLRGFRSSHTPATVVYTGQLERIKAKTIDASSLAEAGLIPHPYLVVKLLYRGDLTTAKTVTLPGASRTAIAAVEKGGGSFTVVSRSARPKSEKNQA